MYVIDHLSQASEKSRDLKQLLERKLVEHARYIRQYGEDMPEIRDWTWARHTEISPGN